MKVTMRDGDPVCEHGTAVDVHCCNCHSGFLFDIDWCVCGQTFRVEISDNESHWFVTTVEGNEHICWCWTERDAQRIADALNAVSTSEA